MEKCLIDNKICAVQGQKCKNCKLDDCRKVIEMIETQEEREYKWKRKLIDAQLPEQCKNCSFLEIIDITKQTVRCPYMLKNCVLKEELLC
jgi:hypothetical protein